MQEQGGEELHLFAAGDLGDVVAEGVAGVVEFIDAGVGGPLVNGAELLREELVQGHSPDVVEQAGRARGGAAPSAIPRPSFAS